MFAHSIPRAGVGARGRSAHILLANSVRIFAGAERFVLDAAQGLARRGYRVTLQAYPDSPLALRARAAGLAVHGVATRADGAFWQVLPLMGWLHHHRVDVVLTNYEKDLRTVGLAAHLCRRPIVVLHSRECDIPLKNRPHVRYFYTRVADRVLANSEATRITTLRSRWLRAEDVRVLLKGIDVDRYARADGRAWRARLTADTREVLLGFAGQLVPRKQGMRLLEALSGPRLRARPWRLCVAGEGPQRTELETTAARLGLSDRVDFVGFVEDLAPWMRCIDVLVHPAEVEGFGYVLVEAAAAGRPVVASRASSVPEIVADGETGLLADPGEAASLSNALERLIDEPDLRERLGGAAQARAGTWFDTKTMLDRLEAILDAEIQREEHP